MIPRYMDSDWPNFDEYSFIIHIDRPSFHIKLKGEWAQQRKSGIKGLG